MIYIAIVIIIIIAVSGRFLTTHDNLKEATNLRKTFELWLKSTDNPRPNNATFVELYKKATGDDRAVVSIINGAGNTLMRDSADVLQSFPSLNRQLVGDELVILDNLVDYYGRQWANNFKGSFWFDYFVYWPQHWLQSAGVKEDSLAAKLANALAWILELLVLFAKPLLARIIEHK